LPDVFTQFRKRAEKYAEVRPLVPTPETIPSPVLEETALPGLTDLGYDPVPSDPRAAIAFQGGAMAAEARLEHYFWETDAVASYKKTRNGLIGADYSTKFSPWLANGSISPRTIYFEVEEYEQEVKKNSSTYWVKFELLWRDYFKFVAMKYGRKIFLKGGIQDKTVKCWQNRRQFDKWAQGKTGDDFVDANMRELLHTGFMSNRGRQNVASYLVHQLKLDWRMGAAWFESLLIDYDVCSNYGNWMYAAGVGNDPRDRVFNTKKQASMYDGEGDYRSLWLKKEKSNS
jgi:deoxyribodipyrimidine photo-lyase